MIERYYKEIRVEFERQKVHIYARKPLYDFLEQKSKKDALVLSEYILREYKKLYGRELKISRDSMAVEILIHVYVDKVLKRIEAKEHAENRKEYIENWRRSVRDCRYIPELLTVGKKKWIVIGSYLMDWYLLRE